MFPDFTKRCSSISQCKTYFQEKRQVHKQLKQKKIHGGPKYVKKMKKKCENPRIFPKFWVKFKHFRLPGTVSHKRFEPKRVIHFFSRRHKAHFVLPQKVILCRCWNRRATHRGVSLKTVRTRFLQTDSSPTKIES